MYHLSQEAEPSEMSALEAVVHHTKMEIERLNKLVRRARRWPCFGEGEGGGAGQGALAVEWLCEQARRGAACRAVTFAQVTFRVWGELGQALSPLGG
jgi:hypothetical protein